MSRAFFRPQASAESKSVDELFYILVIIGGVVFFLIQGMLLISVIFFRARSWRYARDGPTYHGNPTCWRSSGRLFPPWSWYYLAVISFNVWNQNSAPKAAVNMVNGAETVIKVNGARYAWTHTYETEPAQTPNGEPIVINSGDKLHTYIGRMSIWNCVRRMSSILIGCRRCASSKICCRAIRSTGGRPTELRFTPVFASKAWNTRPNIPSSAPSSAAMATGACAALSIVYEDESAIPGAIL